MFWARQREVRAELKKKEEAVSVELSYTGLQTISDKAMRRLSAERALLSNDCFAQDWVLRVCISHL